jgi:cytochrome d ubiquinol oxidase subunit I
VWLVFIGTSLSAYFILAANAWMQRPVGAAVNPERGRAELTSIWEVLTNKTGVYAFAHTWTAALLTRGMLVACVSAWQRWRARGTESAFFTTSLRWGLWTALVAGLATIVVGHAFGQWMTKVQPMKMAAAEVLYETRDKAPLSLFAVGDVQKSPEELAINIEVPRLLSFMATNTFDGTVRGINDIQAEYRERYGPGDYVPILAVTYWSFRIMIGLGFFSVGIAVAGLWLLRRGRDPGRWFARIALLGLFSPLIANTAGWVFTEVGRQPWVVQGLLLTRDGVSPIAGTTVLFSLIALTLLYAALAVIEVWLFTRVVKQGPEPAPKPIGESYLPNLVY